MIAKLTSKNQLTIPGGVLRTLGAERLFEIEVQGARLVLTPVRVQRSDAVRADLAALQLTEYMIAEAIQWARAQ